MGVASSLKVITAGSIWRYTGAAGAGEALIQSTRSDDESEQTLAGMMLVRAGDRSVGAIEDAIQSGRASPQLVDVLASIGSDEARRALQSISPDDGPTGEAATEALRMLDEIGGAGQA